MLTSTRNPYYSLTPYLGRNIFRLRKVMNCAICRLRTTVAVILRLPKQSGIPGLHTPDCANPQIAWNTFTVASVDNIDKNQPGKQMFCGDKSRGFQGTSIQSLTPPPASSLIPGSEQQQEPHSGFFGGPLQLNPAPPAKRSCRSRKRKLTEKVSKRTLKRRKSSQRASQFTNSTIGNIAASSRSAGKDNDLVTNSASRIGNSTGSNDTTSSNSSISDLCNGNENITTQSPLPAPEEQSATHTVKKRIS